MTTTTSTTSDEFKAVLAERDRLRAWLRMACNKLDKTEDEMAKQWAAAIREEAGIDR